VRQHEKEVRPTPVQTGKLLQWVCQMLGASDAHIIISDFVYVCLFLLVSDREPSGSPTSGLGS
jgi:hypothetical protein